MHFNTINQLILNFCFFIIYQIKIITYSSMSQYNRDKYQYGPKSFGMTARKSWFDQGDKSIPGPGTHKHVRINETNPPQWKVGTSTLRNTFLQPHHFPNPPPNNYTPKFLSTRSNNISFSIPQQKLQQKYTAVLKTSDQNNSLLYDPNPNTTKQVSPQYSMGYFAQQDYTTCTPSPNQYFRQSKQEFFNKTQHSFTQAQRPLPYGEHGKWPGVGQYQLKNRHTDYQYTVGHGQRPEVLLGKDSPGIFYQLAGNMQKITLGKTIGANFPLNQSKRQDFPAPNQYNPLPAKTARNIITTYSSRAPLQNVSILRNPNPQKYSTQADFYRRKSCSFTRDQKQKIHVNQNPGPGAHQIRAQLSSRSGLMGKKLNQNVRFVTPGADHYSPKKQYVTQNSPRVINLHSNRVDFSKSLTGSQIGPGSYQIGQQTRAELGKISKSMKFAKQSNKNPGPGSYHIPSGIGKLPQYYSGAKKLSHDGYSTFTLQMWEKQKRQQTMRMEHQKKQKQKEEQQRNNVQA